MKTHFLAVTLLLTLPAQATLFNLEDDALDIIPTQPAKPAPPALPPPSPLPVAAKPDPAPEAQLTSPETRQFPLYRAAHGAYLNGDFKTSFTAFGQLIAEAKKQKSDTAFSVAARVWRERLRLEFGDAKDKARAVANLRKFADDRNAGPARAEALRLLAHERTAAGDPRGAKPWLEKLDQAASAGWEDKDAFLAALTPDARAAATPPDSPWETKPDFFGRIRRAPDMPGQLACAAPRYWREAEAEAKRGLGFIAFLGGDADKAKKLWGGLKELAPPPPEAKDKKQAGKTPSPLWRKLAFAANHGRLLAYPGEENLFAANPRTEDRVRTAEYLYLTDELAAAEEGLRRLIAEDDAEKAVMNRELAARTERMKKGGVQLVEKVRWRGLTDAQRDYLEATLASVLHRSGKSAEATEHLAVVFKTVSGNPVEHRAVVAYGNLARINGTAQQQQQAEQLETALANSTLNDAFTKYARIGRALRLEAAGKKEEAQLLWRRFGVADGAFYAVASKRLAKARER